MTITKNTTTYAHDGNIHECPFCHVLHDNTDQFKMWCEEHEDKKAIWEKRARTEPKTWTWAWACPGCEYCEHEKEALAISDTSDDHIVRGEQ